MTSTFAATLRPAPPAPPAGPHALHKCIKYKRQHGVSVDVCDTSEEIRHRYSVTQLLFHCYCSTLTQCFGQFPAYSEDINNLWPRLQTRRNCVVSLVLQQAVSTEGAGGLRFETPHINVSSRPITVHSSQAQHHGLDSRHGRTFGCDWLLRQWESTDLSLEAVLLQRILWFSLADGIIAVS